MTVDTATTTPVERLRRHFAARAHTTDRARWLDQAWLRAVLVAGGAPDAEVLAVLDREWAAYRAAHPTEPAVTFRPPPPVVEEPVVPGPPPYDELAPLRFGRYGIDLPSHEERVREEQERLARRDSSFYGF